MKASLPFYSATLAFWPFYLLTEWLAILFNHTDFSSSCKNEENNAYLTGILKGLTIWKHLVKFIQMLAGGYGTSKSWSWNEIETIFIRKWSHL